VIGLVANPRSGKDIRRLVANAALSTLADKVSIVRRVLIGAAEAGERRFLVLPDAQRICRQAVDGLRLDVEVDEVVCDVHDDESDTAAAAVAMKAAGCGAVVVLGGDGTNRAVATGWPDVPVIPISTGTNNVFPRQIEATVAGAAAGLVSTGVVPLSAVATPAKVVHLAVEGGLDDLALIDAVLVSDRFVGTRALFDPAMLRVAVLSRSEPASVGMASIGGLVRPCGAGDDAAVVLRFGAGGRSVRAPLAPGLYVDVPVASDAALGLGERVEVTGPGVLALDGERTRVLGDGQRAVLRVERDGPMVIDADEALARGRAAFLR